MAKKYRKKTEQTSRRNSTFKKVCGILTYTTAGLRIHSQSWIVTELTASGGMKIIISIGNEGNENFLSVKMEWMGRKVSTIKLHFFFGVQLNIVDIEESRVGCWDCLNGWLELVFGLDGVAFNFMGLLWLEMMNLRRKFEEIDDKSSPALIRIVNLWKITLKTVDYDFKFYLTVKVNLKFFWQLFFSTFF